MSASPGGPDSAAPSVCLAGDAAHVVTPGGGFGLNLGVQDSWGGLNIISTTSIL